MRQSQGKAFEHSYESIRQICEICKKITDKGLTAFRMGDVKKGEFVCCNPDCHKDLEHAEEGCHLFNEGYRQGYEEGMKDDGNGMEENQEVPMPICPYCRTEVNKHPAIPCADAWLARLMWTDPRIVIEYVSSFDIYKIAVSNSNCPVLNVDVPRFTTLSEAQEEYLYPLLKEKKIYITDGSCPKRGKYNYYCELSKKFHDKPSITIRGEDDKIRLLATWRAAIKYFHLEGKGY